MTCTPREGWSEGKIQPWELQETSRRISGKRVCPARRPKALKAETFGNFQTEEQFWRLGLQKNLVRYAH